MKHAPTQMLYRSAVVYETPSRTVEKVVPKAILKEGPISIDGFKKIGIPFTQLESKRRHKT